MNENKKIVETPLMKQYFEVKAQHPDALLLFRVGDFYETFGEDAVTASKVLGIVLTRRANGAASWVELAGFPYHSIETYLPKLVRSGYKVAVCDQLEDPKLTKKIVKRGVTELVTPGIAYSEQLLNQKENNFLSSVCFSGDMGGIAFLDISTGTFKIAEGSLEYIDILLSNFKPKEVVVAKGYRAGFRERFGDNYYLSALDEWAFVPDACDDKLKKQFGLNSLKGFGIEEMSLGITAAGAILFYLEQNHNAGVCHLCSISRVDRDSFVWLDRFTFRNLEIFSSAGGSDGVSLLEVVDKTSSPLGARLLRSWLSMPLKDKAEIERRHEAVEYFTKNAAVRTELQTRLSGVGDLERITSKAAAGKIAPREIIQLKRGLEQMEPVKHICLTSGPEPLRKLGEEISLFENLRREIGLKILPEPAAQFGKGDIVADGVCPELDELRQLARHSKEYLLYIQEREIGRTGISSLKISYNNVFGYYLEVRNAHKEKVPPEWIRKQTLVNAERYITQELKEYEEKILGAEERINALEQEVYAGVVEAIRQEIAAIQQSGAAVARIDCLAGFAQLACENKYCRPRMEDGFRLEIEQGRHPVIEPLMGPGEEYVANDLVLDNNSQQIIILTGPNMAGKSALLRQTALIVLLAQIGSFVPAARASVGITDKIFTRVGASDNISRGESTFMVEMIETSTILHNLSERSLVLLDEIGRGTSTFDGMSIAWAIVEYIHQSPFRAKTLFATHYHELNELENLYPRVKNYHIAVKEVDKKVVFLRKLSPGGVAHSFGIHVARMAGIPQQVIDSAQRTLNMLESSRDNSPAGAPSGNAAAGEEQGRGAEREETRGQTEEYRKNKAEAAGGTIGTRKGRLKEKKSADGLQLSFYQLEDPLLAGLRDKLRAMDINTMSPLDAFDALRDLKKQIGLER